MAGKGQGKWAQGAKGKWKKGAVGKWKKGKGAGKAPGPGEGSYAGADLTTTSYLRTQGRAYAASREGRSGFLAGVSDAWGKKKPKGKGKGGGGKGGKAKNLLDVRGKRQQSGVAPGFHISKQGLVVKNKGKRK